MGPTVAFPSDIPFLGNPGDLGGSWGNPGNVLEPLIDDHSHLEEESCLASGSGIFWWVSGDQKCFRGVLCQYFPF